MRRIGFIASAMVVFLHSYSKALSSARDGSVAWWIQDLVSQGICRVAVPYFFVVFGFWLVKGLPLKGRSLVSWWRCSVGSRTKTLLIPYFVWSFVSMVGVYLLTRFATTQICSFEFLSLHWWLDVMGVSSYPKFAFHLWFVKTIFLYALLAPAIWLLVDKTGVYGCVALLCFSIVCDGMGDWLTQAGPFICIGCLLATKGRELLEREAAIPLTTCVNALWLVFVGLKVIGTNLGYCDIYGGCTVLGCHITVMPIINTVGLLSLWMIYDHIRSSYLDVIVHSSFFVYCSHPLVMALVGAGVKHVNYFESSPCVKWALTPLISLSVCIAMWLVLRKRTPRVLALLSGGR